VVLTVSGITLAGGCASPERPGSSSDSAQAARSDAARDRAIAAEADLLARYDAALALPAVAADAALVSKLTAIRAEHASHAAAIKDGYVASPTPTSSPSSAATPSGSSAPASSGPSSTPASDPKATIAALIKADQEAAGARTADILAADGGTAMLLASVAASESGHAALLLGGAA
jgi:hypothetical protein